VPLAVHVWMPLPEHCTWPGAQMPVHVPLTHVWFAHAVPAVHVPVALQVCGWLEPEQLVCPGAHTPLHAPLTHVWLLQATAVPQVPVELQVSTPLPEHVVCPGAHTPEHTPFTHVWLLHAVTVAPHVPLDWQVW
jgi:hypothetical protein